jgi:Asp/Glu/hydantoin racemase
MCLVDRFAGERALEMSVAETASGARTLDRLIEVGQALKEEDGANMIILGCAGMARHRAAVERALALPVIDPTQAAAVLAIGTIQARRAPVSV